MQARRKGGKRQTTAPLLRWVYTNEPLSRPGLHMGHGTIVFNATSEQTHLELWRKPVDEVLQQ